MKLTRLSYTNFKGGTAALDITGREVFFGPNGSGKTRNVQAIMIGMLGYDPTSGNPPRKAPGETMKLASADEMSIGMEFDDGAFSFTRTFRRDAKGAISQEVVIQGEEGLGNTEASVRIAKVIGDFPMMFNPAEFLSKTSDKKMEFIRPFLPAAKGNAREMITEQSMRDLLGNAAVDAILKFKFDNKTYEDLDAKQKLDFAETCIQSVKESDETTGLVVEGLLVEMVKRSNLRTPLLQSLHSQLEWIKGEAKDARVVAKEAAANVKSLMKERGEAQLAAAQLPELKKNTEAAEAELKAAEKEMAEAEQKEGRILDLGKRKTQLEAERAKTINFTPVDSKIHTDAMVAAGNVAADLAQALESWKTTYQSDYPKADGFEKEQKAINAEAEAKRNEIGALKQEINVNLQIIDLLDKTELLCPECGYRFEGTADDKKKTVTELEAKHEKAKQEYAAIAEKAVALSKKFEAAKLHITTMTDLHARHQRKFEALQVAFEQDAEEIKKRNARCREIDAEIIGLQKQIQSHTPPDVSVLESQIEGLTGQLSGLKTELEKAHRASGILEQIEKSSLKQMEADKKLEVLKTMEGSIKSVRNRLSESSIMAITKKANELLQSINPKYEMGVVLEDDKGCETFDLTLKSNGIHRPIQTLSGGETVLAVSVAFVTALIDLADPAAKVLILEAAEVDNRNMPGLLSGAATMQTQKHLDNVVLARWLPCEAPDWSVHVMGE